MKKLLLAIIALGLFVLVMTSCSAFRSTDCPAYGEVHKYQIEQKY